MRLSTRGRYAVRSLIDLTVNEGDGFVSLQSISERQEISLHYLEQIYHKLRKAGLVKSKKGLGGGYVLARPAGEITVGDIIRAVEGPIGPVPCLNPPGKGKSDCTRVKGCVAHLLWRDLEVRLEEFLDGVNLQQLKERTAKVPCE